MRLRQLLAITALSLTPLAGNAQSSGTITFQPNSGGLPTAFGFYVGPFWGTLASDPTKPTIDLFCVDVLNAVSFGYTWNANFTNLASGDLSLTRHGDAKTAKYQQAAYLASMYKAPSVTSSQFGGLQAAIWNLLNPGYPNGGTNVLSTSSEAYWLGQANSWFNGGGASNFDFSKWTIVTDVSAAGRVWGYGTQEFITSGLNTAVTPEPETWMLMGTGLMLIVGFAIKRGRLV